MRLLLLGLVLLLGACAQQGVKNSVQKEAVFYPPLPDAPRIQHLTSIAGERDLTGAASAFEQFVLGEDLKSQQLKQPYGLALYDSKLYVADSRAPGLAVFDLKRQTFSLISGSGGAQMRRPINIRIDSNGTKYVTDTGLNQILVFDREDRFLQAIGERGQFKPVDVAIAGDRLYVSDIEHHQIHVLDKQSGRLLFKIGKPGSAPGELFHPTNLAIADNGDVLVVETSNFRVQRFTPEGMSVRTYGSIGTRPGSFARPKGIALDGQGRMYVSDAAFENVQLYDPEGKLLLYFGQPDGKGGGLNLPAALVVDYANIAYFQKYADPKFQIQYLIFTSSQFGPNRVDVFAFGRMNGMSYPTDTNTPMEALPVGGKAQFVAPAPQSSDRSAVPPSVVSSEAGVGKL